MAIAQQQHREPEAQEVETRTVSTPCRECSAGIEYPQIRVLGRWVGSAPSTCEDCNERHMRASQEVARIQEEDRLRILREGRQARILDLLEEAGASPWEHGAARIEELDEPVRIAAESWVSAVLEAGRYDPVRSLYLWGPAGTGKSFAATAILRALLLDPRVDPGQVVYDPADVFVSRVRALYGGRGDVDGFLRRRERARVWILDDLGREPDASDARSHLTLLVAQRALRPSIMTSNYAPSDVGRRRSGWERVESRLGPAYVADIHLGGADRRMQGRRR